jgi:uncharacterized repeat protein (TIGR04138 family)
MQVTRDALKQLRLLSERNGRYRINAYLFVLTGLDDTLKRLNRHNAKEAVDRHVTGQELALGLRDFALAEFGPSARMVLTHWGIKSTLDFGNIVYDLISVGLMGKSESDKLEDFKEVYDFEKELETGYRFNVGHIRS